MSAPPITISDRPPPVPRLALSVREAAQSLGLSERVVAQLVRDGRIRSSRAGRRVLVSVDAIRAWLAAGEVTDE